MYTYVYVCMYMYIHVYVCIRMYIHVYVYVCIYMYMCVILMFLNIHTYTHGLFSFLVELFVMLSIGERVSGQDVRTQNVTAAIAIANIVKTSLGKEYSS